MKKLYMRAALLTCATIAVSPAFANHSWGGYHWSKSGSKVQLEVRKAITSQWTTSVNRAITDWNQSTVIALTGVTASGVKHQEMQPGRRQNPCLQ